MNKEKWINFKKPMFIGVDYDCKFNPLNDWQQALKLKIDNDVIGYDFKIVAYKKVKISDYDWNNNNCRNYNDLLVFN